MTAHLSRRRALQGGFSVGLLAALASTVEAQSALAGTTVALSSYGSPSAADNSNALLAAANAAGFGGTVTVSAGVWNIAQNITLPSVTIVGISPTTTRFCFTGTSGAPYYGFNSNGGVTIRNMGIYGSGGGTSSFLHVGGDTTVDTCDFYEPKNVCIDIYGGTLTVTNSRFIGQARGFGGGIAVSNSSSNLVVTGSLFSGLYQGHTSNGGGNVKASGNTYLGLWYYGNMSVCQGKVASATSTSVTAAAALPTTTFQANATAAAWKTISSSSTVSPVSGKSGWFTISGITPEARMMVRNASKFGVVLRTSGSQAYIPYWHSVSCYPTPTPTSATAGMTVERPYVGRVASISGRTVTVLSWHAGSKGTNEVPPAGARLQINDRGDYQCFTTNGNASMSVDSCTFVAGWADQVSSIAGQNVSVTNNTLYDGQDVSITLERITNGCVASGNVAYRSGTAMVYIGSGSAQVSANTSNGANMMTDNSPSYSAFTIQGAPWANVWSNTAIYGGAPFEMSGLSIDGVDGQDNTSDQTRTQGPWATDLYVNSMTFTGYPSYDVTIWGTKAFCEKGHTTWPAGMRPRLLQGATRDMLAL